MINMINHVADVWWSLSASIFWQVGLLIVAIACVDVLLRKFIWPQIRYALWLMVLVKLVLPPGLYSPSSVTSGVQPLAQKLAVTTPDVQQANETTMPYHSLTAPSLVMETDRTLLRALGQDHIAPSITIVETPSRTVASPSLLASLNWHVYVMGLWMLGTGTFGLWLFIRLRRLRQGLPNTQNSLPVSFYNQLELCAQRVGLQAIPKVVVTNRVIVPAVMGVWRPVLLMPIGFLGQLSRKDTKHMLLHELSHIKRGDLWVHHLYMILQITYWYNPLLWLVSRQMHHLRELCCDASVAGLLKEQTMEYRNTLLDVARRYLSRPTEPSLGMLGLFEDANRLAVRLNWLKKDTHRFKRTRTLLIVLLVGTMLACVLPMAQAEDAPKATQTSTVGKAKAEAPPSEYAELIKEIEALKQRVILKDNKTQQAATDIVATGQASVLEAEGTESADEEKEALRKQVQFLTLQQHALAQQLEHLKAALDHADKANVQQKSLKQQFQTQLKHLDTAEDKMKDVKQRMAESERLHALVRSMDEMGKRVDQWVDVNGLQVIVKKHTSTLPSQITHHIQTWTDSKDFKQWQQDMKAWELDMQAWSKHLAKVAEGKIKNFKPDDMSFDVPMPKMPGMPPMPFGTDHPHEQPDLPSLPDAHPNVHPQVHVETHVVAPGSPQVVMQQIKLKTDGLAQSTKTMTLSFPDIEMKCQSVTLKNKVGDITVLGTEDTQCSIEIAITAKAKKPSAAQDLVNQVHVTTDEDNQVLTIMPETPENSEEAQVTVAFTLKIPRTLNLNLTTQVGNITLRNMESQINCHTNVGDISAQAITKTLNANTNVGKVFLAVTADTDAKISASSQVGKIKSMRTLSMKSIKMTGQKGTLVLGSGKIPMNLSVNVGDIHIRVDTQADMDKVRKPKIRTDTHQTTITSR